MAGKYWMSNKGRLRPCEYTIDPVYHHARLQGLNGVVDLSASQLPSNATTPATVADSPGPSELQSGSDEDYKPDDSSSIIGDMYTKGESDTSMMPIAYARKPLPTVNGVGGGGGGGGMGKGKGKGKGAGKQLPPMPVSLRDEKPSPRTQQQYLSNIIKLPPPRQSSQTIPPPLPPPPKDGTPLAPKSSAPSLRKRPVSECGSLLVSI